MKKISLFLCLILAAGLAGCASTCKDSKSREGLKKPVINEEEVRSIVSIFTKAIEKNPNYAGAYYNRAIAYFYLKEYEKCWQDVHKAEALGLSFNPDFIVELKRVPKK